MPAMDGVAREVLEETGVKVHAEQLTGVYSATPPAVRIHDGTNLLSST
jgi:ADP-ribose pyrophosphatase YjhB (NUDIX family)